PPRGRRRSRARSPRARRGCGPSPCPRAPFFFSSRRRHTRSKRDWSSDVCSSDLLILIGAFVFGFLVTVALALMFPRLKVNESERSEERRVGKECRSRWGRGH